MIRDFQDSLLPAAARIAVPVQCVFSIYLLLRGHNLPGGGFIGGLVLASAIVLHVMVKPVDAPRRDPGVLAGLGLLCSLAAACSPLFFGERFFTGVWGGEFWLPAIGKVKFGSVLFFDIGVFLVVTGVAAKILLVLLDSHRAAREAGAEPSR